MIIATGAAYRRLGIETLEAYAGSGVFYGAAASEVEALQGGAVHIVGGANSAGQAALYLAQHAAQVTLIVRGEGLKQTMSDYLIRAIETAPNITVRCATRGSGWFRRSSADSAHAAGESIRNHRDCTQQRALCHDRRRTA